MNATQLKFGGAILVVVFSMTGWFLAERRVAKLTHELASAKKEASAQTTQDDEAAVASQAHLQDELVRLRRDHSELMRLRAEVTQLRARTLDGAASTNGGYAMMSNRGNEPAKEDVEDKIRRVTMNRMQAASAWGVAIMRYAELNGGRLPTSFSDAAGYFPPEFVHEATPYGGNSGGVFEFTFNGQLDQIENPAEAIIMRERDPFHRGPDGSALRTYLFADGHTEIYTAPGGDFDEWEAAHAPRLPPKLPNGGSYTSELTYPLLPHE